MFSKEKCKQYICILKLQLLNGGSQRYVISRGNCIAIWLLLPAIYLLSLSDFDHISCNVFNFKEESICYSTRGIMYVCVCVCVFMIHNCRIDAQHLNVGKSKKRQCVLYFLYCCLMRFAHTHNHFHNI